MQSPTRRSETPANNGMTIVQNQPTNHLGQALDATLPSLVSVVPTVNGHVNSATSNVAPGRLSRAGMIAMLAAVNTYLSGLSTATLDAMYGTPGLSVSITPTLVQVPCAPAGAATLAASIATVLSTGGNVVNA